MLHSLTYCIIIQDCDYQQCFNYSFPRVYQDLNGSANTFEPVAIRSVINIGSWKQMEKTPICCLPCYLIKLCMNILEK